MGALSRGGAFVDRLGRWILCLLVGLSVGVLSTPLGARSIWDGAVLEVQAVPLFGEAEVPGTRQGMALDRDGRVYVVYARWTGLYNQKLYIAYRDPDASWHYDIQVPCLESFHIHAGIVVTPIDNAAHVVFVVGGFPTPGVRYMEHARFDRLTEKLDIDTIAQTDETLWHQGHGFSVGADTLGGVHVAWGETYWNEQQQRQQDRLMYAENCTGVWHKQMVTDYGYLQRMNVRPDGQVYIAYRNYELYHAIVLAQNRFRGDTAWSLDSLDTGTMDMTASACAVAHDGTVHVIAAWRWCIECGTKYAMYTQRDPLTGVWAPFREIYYPSALPLLQLDCWGEPHVLDNYYSPSDIAWEQVYLHRRDTSWVQIEPTWGSLGQVSIWQPRFAVDRANRIHALFDKNGTMYYFYVPTIIFDALDLNALIDHIYYGVFDCECSVYDQDCDQQVDSVDLVGLIEYLFFNGPRGCR